MKYYYNGKLMRTSNHVYTHAVIDNNGKCVACRNGYANAVKAKNAERSDKAIREANNAINALKAGRSYYFFKIGQCSYKHTFEAKDTIERYQGVIERANEWNKVVDSWQIVELEAK